MDNMRIGTEILNPCIEFEEGLLNFKILLLEAHLGDTFYGDIMKGLTNSC